MSVLWGVPRECACGHMDVDHEQLGERFGACFACSCPSMRTARVMAPGPKSDALRAPRIAPNHPARPGVPR